MKLRSSNVDVAERFDYLTGVLTVLHACDDLVVVDKPSGLLVHRGWADDEDVLVERVRARFGAVFPVHRLDRGTSGVIVFARSSEVARRLHDAFEAGLVEKRYVALVRGALLAPLRVDRPLPRREDGPRVPSATSIVPLASVALADSTLREKRYSFVVAHPETGRLHQVRRHSKSSGHPIIGDANYGKSEHNRWLAQRVGLERLALHAISLEVPHPRTGQPLPLHAPLPDDLAGPLRDLGFDVPALASRALDRRLFAKGTLDGGLAPAERGAAASAEETSTTELEGGEDLVHARIAEPR